MNKTNKRQKQMYLIIDYKHNKKCLDDHDIISFPMWEKQHFPNLKPKPHLHLKTQNLN